MLFKGVCNDSAIFDVLGCSDLGVVGISDERETRRDGVVTGKAFALT